MALTLAIARTEFGALPATYRRNTRRAATLLAMRSDRLLSRFFPDAALLPVPKLRDGAVIVRVTQFAQHRQIAAHERGGRSGRVGQDDDFGAAGPHLGLNDLHPRGGFGLREFQLKTLVLQG